MMHRLCALLLLALWGPVIFGQEPPKVSLNDLGTLVGKEIKTRSGRTIHGFQGIPFAESPSGPNRFKAPIAKIWSGELDATHPGSPCVQPDVGKLKRSRRGLIWDLPIKTNFSLPDPEDCLSLNVYTPDLSHSKQLPVVVFFHGGSFLTGSEAKFRPEFLLDRDVILVVPHYRLGPFGFLSMQDETIPGNAGLLDAIEALRWVQKHIEKFGGNEDQVTAFGQSAGAAISNFVMLSPLSKGLIHGVICNSGSPLASWAIDTDPVKSAKKIGRLAGCLGAEDTISQCIQNLNPETLLNAYSAYSNLGGSGGTLPVVSRPDEPEATRILPKDPTEIAQSGSYPAVPMMGGATRHDSIWMVDIIYSILRATNLTENEDFVRNEVPHRIVEFGGLKDPLRIITDMMEKKYLDYVAPQDRGNFSKLKHGILDFETTVTMKAPGYRMVQLNSKHADSYWYSFDYQGRYHLIGNGIVDPGSLFTTGATHSDDMIYLTPRIDDPFNEEESKLSQLMVDLWANFITSSNPNEPKKIDPVWPKYDKQDEPYFEINKLPRVKNDFTADYTAAIQDLKANSAGKKSGLTLLIFCTVLGMIKFMQ